MRKFTLSGTSTSEIKFEIVNTLGQVVHHNNIIPENGRLYKEIDLGAMANGVYIVKISGEGMQHIQRFVKE